MIFWNENYFQKYSDCSWLWKSDLGTFNGSMLIFSKTCVYFFKTDVTHYWVFGCPSAYWYIYIPNSETLPITYSVCCVFCRVADNSTSHYTLLFLCSLRRRYFLLNFANNAKAAAAGFEHARGDLSSHSKPVALPTELPGRGYLPIILIHSWITFWKWLEIFPLQHLPNCCNWLIPFRNK